MVPIATAAGPIVDAAGVTFRLPDAHRRLCGVRLVQDVRALDDQLDFGYRRGAWRLRLPRPAVDRMEYLLELVHHDGGRQTITDPDNPDRVPGAFGDKSLIEFPGYLRPAWLDWPASPSTRAEVTIVSRQLGATVHAQLWAAEALGPGEPAPLLIVHDGPEYAALASFLQYAATQVAAGRLPPLRVALLAPGDRNRWYAVNPAYARALVRDVLPLLEEIAPASERIGVGASLGGLAMLHAHRMFPGVFDALFLQSGSFFHPDLDPQERRFSRFGPVTRFVLGLMRAASDDDPVPVVLTCGRIEENLANNRLMARTLRRLGYPVQMREVRDVHNYTAWRDALDPYLTQLVAVGEA